VDVGAAALRAILGTDPANRPLYPALFITNLTINGIDACYTGWWLRRTGGHPGKFCGELAGGRPGGLADDVFGT